MKYISITLAAVLLALSSFAQPTITVRTNVYNITVSSRGIANGGSLVFNDGAQFGPDTPGTTTSGIQEAFDAFPQGTDYGPLANGVTYRFVTDNSYYFFTNLLTFSNGFPASVTFKGQSMLATKLVYAGNSNNVRTITIKGRNRHTLVNLEDMGFSAINNTTNTLVYLTNLMALNVTRCLFTGWQIMTNQGDGASFSVATGQSYLNNLPPPGLVGIEQASGGGSTDHGATYTDVYFAGTAVGLLCGADHLIVRGMRSCFVSAVGSGGSTYTNLWNTNNIRSVGAVLIRYPSNTLDTYIYDLFPYASKAGYVDDAGDDGTLIGFHAETVGFPIASSRLHAPKNLLPTGTTPFVGRLQGTNSLWPSTGYAFLGGSGNTNGPTLVIQDNLDRTGAFQLYHGTALAFNMLADGTLGLADISETYFFLATPDGTVTATTFAGAFSGNGSGLTGVTPTITNATAYAAGTAYTLTGSSAALDFGTTDPVLTIPVTGTYVVMAHVGVKYNAATYATAQTVTFKLRRTNNTAADLSNGSRAVELPVLTTFTGGDVMALPSVVYSGTAGDTVTIFGILSATPSAGSVVADTAELIAIRLY